MLNILSIQDFSPGTQAAVSCIFCWMLLLTVVIFSIPIKAMKELEKAGNKKRVASSTVYEFQEHGVQMKIQWLPWGTFHTSFSRCRTGHEGVQ